MKMRFKGIDHHSFFNLIAIIIVGLFLFSCMQQPKGTGRKTSSAGSTSDSTGGSTTPSDPTFDGVANFLQNGSTQSNTSMTLPGDFTTSLYLRGSQVDRFIKDSNKSTVQCLAIPYPTAGVQKVLVIAAYPRFFFNFSTNAQEYYYLLEPASSGNNSTFCQKPGVLTSVASLFAGTTSVYQLADVCPNCGFSNLVSNPLVLMTQDGLTVTDVNLINLRVEVRPESSSSIPSNLTCSVSSECQSKGFDCCSFGQCVNDKQVRSNVDQTSSAFNQALLDIQENPEAILNYQEFFHICGSNVTPDPVVTPRPDPAIEASERFLHLKSLYDCTTPIEGEMSICQVEFTDTQDIITDTSSNIFLSGADDRNFNDNYSGTSTLPPHSLFEVRYAGEILFENGAIVKGMTIGPGGDNSGNDNLDDSQILNLTHTPSTSASNDTLSIKYKIDGSCEEISPFLAKCYKEYVQGQNLGKVNDHFPASNNFLLPYYADTNKTISVTVDEAQSLQFTNWNLIQTTPARIEFVGSSLAVFDTQVVRITYFVNLQNYPNVLLKKKEALTEIQSICGCGTTDCFLKEKLDSNNNVVDFECYYPPPPLPPPPLQQTVLVSAKSAPHRFYDQDGIYHESAEDSLTKQEGDEFLYTNSDLLRPNNASTYIGFNEIYGSFTKKSGTALPATEVRVVTGKTYDIYTDNGSFSTCFFCGTDYYSSLARIFPQNFLSHGGGYTPDLQNNNPLATKEYRKDDLLFGRACFVPATMIPWTHVADTNRQDQRRRRLTAQHFMFANGYQRDWYGFDYGSVIGSFDGVRWFSIGNQRRIQARSNKLFIAINSYFADLTDNTTFSVTVQDTSSISGLGSFVTTDFESDGAECQKAHICESDSDCASQLGWDYTCESITNLTSPWPRFDSNGLEVPGVADTVNLRNLFGQTNGSTRRCVYRGRGAACMPDYTTQDNTSTYSGTNQTGFHACSNNTYCQPFIEGVAVEKFNNRIARFGKTVKSQNASSFVEEDDLDTIGLGARIIGRPFAWIGTDSIPADAQSNLSTNNVTSMCIPGRDSNNDTFTNNHVTDPTSEALGDQISNIGVTPPLTEGLAGVRADYLSRCSIVDSNGNYLSNQRGTITAGDASVSNIEDQDLSSTHVSKLAANQAIATNALAIFESNNLTGNELIKNYEDEFVDEFFYQENRCLRAPGSTCFSALDCAPNPYISDQLASLNVDDSTVTDLINKYEVKFWQEELVCSQEVPATDPDFDLAKNRCCRETGNNVTIGTSTTDANGSSNSDLDFRLIPGVNTSISSQTRNSRLATVWDKIFQDNTEYPALRSVRPDVCGSGCGDPAMLRNQFNTFSEMATRTCCSKNWVRLFDKDENGGGHAWGPEKLQQVPKETFRCYNYAQCAGSQCGDDDGDTFTGFTCSHTQEPDDPNCRARQIPTSEAGLIFDWVATFELTGIPQVAIKGLNEPTIECSTDPLDQSVPPSGGPTGLLSGAAIGEYTEGGVTRFSANDMANFDDDNIKKVFSPDQVACCLPAGTDMPQGADPNLCCTGYIGGSNKCQLPAYTDVTLYLNKYVSSEAQDEVIGAFDQDTGYLVSPFDVIRIACKKQLCESNALVEGVALSNLRTRGHEGSDKQKQRFLDGDDESNNKNGISDLYDRGLRWNTHIYCFDQELTEALPGTIDCGTL